DVGPVEITAEPIPPTNLLDTAADSVAHGVRRTLGVGQRAATNAAELAGDPSRLVQAAADLVETGRPAGRPITVTDQAHSSLWEHRTLRRRMETLDASLEEARRAAKALGGSINDIFVTGAVRGAGRYHRDHGADVTDLRMAMPVSTRSDASMGGN